LYHRPRAGTALYDPVMTVAIWLSLGFLVVASVGSLVYAATRALRTWRAVRGASQRVTDALQEVEAAGRLAEERATGLAGGTERLTAAVERLQESLARLAVLNRAATEARGALGLLRGAVPRK
jgi:hypothetical protein